VTFDPTTPAPPEPAAAPTESATFAPQAVTPGAPRIQPGPPRRRNSGAWLNVVLVAAMIVAVGGVAFAIGRNTAPTTAAGGRGNGNGFFGNGNFARGSFAPDGSGGPGGFLGGRGGGGFNISGTVQSVSGDTLTVTTANGQTLEFTLGSTTAYDTQSPATAAAVKTGSKVEVQLQPGSGGFGGFRPNASGAPSGPIGTASRVTVVP
jgi:hypothetical protein